MTGTKLEAPHGLREYVELPGGIVARPPYAATDALLHSFFVPGSRAALQLMVDRAVNNPAGGKLRFYAVSSYVLLAALYIDRIQSTDPIEALKGYVRESDLGFWILTLGGPSTDVKEWKLRWMPTYMFVDSVPAVAVGREVFGYPKNYGTIVRAGKANDEGAVKVTALAYPKYGPDECASEQVIFQVKPNLAPPPDENAQPATLDSAQQRLRNIVENDEELIEHAALDLASNWMPTAKMPMLFLKQFRDIAVPNRACYQAVTDEVTTTQKIKAIGWFNDTYSLSVTPLQSHPIVKDLGIKNDAPILSPFWLIQDFSAGFGRELWS